MNRKNKTSSLFPRIKSKFWFLNGRVASYPATTRIRRFYSRLRGYSFSKVYIKVEYGIKESNAGKVMFYNDATVTDKKHAVNILDAFLEK